MAQLLTFCYRPVLELPLTCLPTVLKSPLNAPQFYCGLLHCVGNALFIALPGRYAALLAGRLLIGLAHGACYVCLVQHAGDNTAREVRGRILSSIGVTLTLSTVVYVTLASVHQYQVLYTTVHDAGAAHTLGFRWLGCAGLVFAICGLLLVARHSVESVLFLLQRRPPMRGSPADGGVASGGDSAAVAALLRLRQRTVLTASVHAELLELQQIVADDARLSSIIFRNGNVRPLLLLVGMRLMHWASDNVLLNGLQVPGSRLADREWNGVAVPQRGIDYQLLVFVPLVLVLVRLVFAAVAALCADRVRRRFVLAQMFGGGSVVLLIAVLTTVMCQSVDRHALMFAVLYTKVQAFYGWSADTVPHVMAAEAFGLRKKAWSVAFAGAVENAVHALGFVVFFALTPSMDAELVLLYGFGLAAMALAALLFWHMPETCGLTLTQCRNKFRGVYDGGVVYSREYLGDLQRQQAYKISVY